MNEYEALVDWWMKMDVVGEKFVSYANFSIENYTSTDPRLIPCIHSDKPVTNAWAKICHVHY